MCKRRAGETRKTAKQMHLLLWRLTLCCPYSLSTITIFRGVGDITALYSYDGTYVRCALINVSDKNGNAKTSIRTVVSSKRALAEKSACQ